jgi:hypothetical protein
VPETVVVLVARRWELAVRGGRRKLAVRVGAGLELALVLAAGRAGTLAPLAAPAVRGIAWGLTIDLSDHGRRQDGQEVRRDGDDRVDWVHLSRRLSF